MLLLFGLYLREICEYCTLQCSVFRMCQLKFGYVCVEKAGFVSQCEEAIRMQMDKAWYVIRLLRQRVEYLFKSLWVHILELEKPNIPEDSLEQHG